jgi:hypothetical protein
VEDADFSDDFCRFLQENIPSVDAAELLLYLRAHPDRAWLAAEAAANLRPTVQISDADAARYLESFQARGLVSAEPDKRAQFRPANEALEMYTQMLALAYKQRPVTLIRMIYALRDLRIQTFADAFKIRKS